MANNKRNYIIPAIMSIGLCLSASACKSNIEIPKVTVSYGPEIGFADGNVSLSDTDPILDISDIQSVVGENIDYLSKVSVSNEDMFEDLEIWADASCVDIFTPGNYTATYTFVYDDNSISKDITVTIIPNETEPSAGETDNGKTPENNNNNNNDNSQTQNTHSVTVSTTQSNNQQQTASQKQPEQVTTIIAQQTSSAQVNQQTSKQPAPQNPETETTTKHVPQESVSKPPVATTPAATTPATSTDSETTTRQIITTSGNDTTENKNIGNYTIELLSGKYITIKNTTSSYIVSTRTDFSQSVRNGKTYRVSKLIITYNTGAEQVLETVEERVN